MNTNILGLLPTEKRNVTWDWNFWRILYKARIRFKWFWWKNWLCSM